MYPQCLTMICSSAHPRELHLPQVEGLVGSWLWPKISRSGSGSHPCHWPECSERLVELFSYFGPCTSSACRCWTHPHLLGHTLCSHCYTPPGQSNTWGRIHGPWWAWCWCQPRWRLRPVATPSHLQISIDFTLLWTQRYLASMCFILPTPCRCAKARQLEESEAILATTSFLARKPRRGTQHHLRQQKGIHSHSCWELCSFGCGTMKSPTCCPQRSGLMTLNVVALQVLTCLQPNRHPWVLPPAPFRDPQNSRHLELNPACFYQELCREVAHQGQVFLWSTESGAWHLFQLTLLAWP